MKTNWKIEKLPKERYPHLLRQISRLPETMDIVGDLPSDENKFLCVIGSRKNSNYGREACEKLIAGLAGYPIVIVSGLAIGIDSIAHAAAMAAGLKTISFPGSGLNWSVLYPKGHRDLAIEIVQSGGCLISQFAADQGSQDWTFPARNRLMAGASHATLIIEACQGSGTLITADYAAEFGRDILAVPGSIFAETSYGPHMLIRRGATPVSSAEEILQSLGFKTASGTTGVLPNFAEMALNDDERRIVNHLRIEPLTASDLMEKISLPTAKFNAVISGLELQGVIIEREGCFRLA